MFEVMCLFLSVKTLPPKPRNFVQVKSPCEFFLKLTKSPAVKEYFLVYYLFIYPCFNDELFLLQLVLASRRCSRRRVLFWWMGSS